ncbi:hypothetical protein KCU67_g9880, partial [Aureobasidium melanogenum]
MAIQDNTIVGLRTQILENWKYANQTSIDPIVVVTRRDSLYEAVLTSEDYSQNRVLMSSRSCAHVEHSLRELLNITCEMVEGKLRSKRNATGKYSLW